MQQTDTIRSTRALSACFVLISLCVVAYGDYATGWGISFSLVYLIPVALATWGGGQYLGLSACAAAAAARLLIRLRSPEPLAQNLWNTGVLFGILLTFCVLLAHLRKIQRDFPVARILARLMTIGVGTACVLAAIGLVAQRKLGETAALTRTPALQQPAIASTQAVATGPIYDLAGVAHKLAECLERSRPVLLGSRDPKIGTCVVVGKSGTISNKVPDNIADLDGGPGTKLAVLISFDRQACTRPTIDFAWHQTRLKTYLQNEVIENQPAQETADELFLKATALRDALASERSWPTGFSPIQFSDRQTWPAYCLAALNDAVAARDLPRAKRWSSELAAACFAIQDLHRWLGFLTENYLTALSFQQKCAPVFAAADAEFRAPYDAQSTTSMLPAGLITLHGGANFYEVEREAERLYTMPSDRLAALTSDADPTESSIWMPPSARQRFVMVEAVLSPENRRTWKLAAQTPYEHTYLVNMLQRASQVGAADEQLQVIGRFNALTPHATVGELMSVLMYRGHSFAGLEWADRFQPLLMQASAQLSGTDEQAFMAACQWTSGFYRTPASYGVTYSLRAALETRRLDCVRATDMIGALFRDSGRARFGHVRWCAQTNAHSVGAYLGRENGKERVLLADALNPPEKPEIWPDAYFHGHSWPPGLQPTPTPYSVELYVRGLDNYIWAEGYIVRGPNAGTLMSAAIPYSQHRTDAVTRKVFDGPYPQ